MTGSSRLFAVPGWKLALGLEFVAQVVQRVVLAVRLGADGGAGGGDQVVEVGQGPGQPRRSRPTSADSSGIRSSARVSVPRAEAAASCRRAASSRSALA